MYSLRSCIPEDLTAEKKASGEGIKGAMVNSLVQCFPVTEKVNQRRRRLLSVSDFKAEASGCFSAQIAHIRVADVGLGLWVFPISKRSPRYVFPMSIAPMSARCFCAIDVEFRTQSTRRDLLRIKLKVPAERTVHFFFFFSAIATRKIISSPKPANRDPA